MYKKDHSCNGCPVLGICCYFEARVQGMRISTDEPCEHLDVESGSCKIFANRFKINPDCKSLRYMIKHATVPIECVHVKNKKEYKDRLDRRIYNFKIILADVEND